MMISKNVVILVNTMNGIGINVKNLIAKWMLALVAVAMKQERLMSSNNMVRRKDMTMIECYGICSENCTAWQNGKCVLDAKKAEVTYDFETKEEIAEGQQYGQRYENQRFYDIIKVHENCQTCS